MGGGVLYPLNTVYANNGGVLNEIYSSSIRLSWISGGGGTLSSSSADGLNVSVRSSPSNSTIGKIEYSAQAAVTDQSVYISAGTLMYITGMSIAIDNPDARRDSVSHLYIYDESKNNITDFSESDPRGGTTAAINLVGTSGEVLNGAYEFKSSGKYYFGINTYGMSGNQSGTTYYPHALSCGISFRK